MSKKCRSSPRLVVRGRDQMPEAQRHLNDSTPRKVELLDHVAADVADLDLEGANEYRLHRRFELRMRCIRKNGIAAQITHIAKAISTLQMKKETDIDWYGRE